MTPYATLLGLLALNAALATATPTLSIHTIHDVTKECSSIVSKSPIQKIGKCFSALLAFERDRRLDSRNTVDLPVCDTLVAALAGRDERFQAGKDLPDTSARMQAGALYKALNYYCRLVQEPAPPKKDTYVLSLDEKLSYTLNRAIVIEEILQAPHAFVPHKTDKQTLAQVVFFAMQALIHSAEALKRPTPTGRTPTDNQPSQLIQISMAFLSILSKRSRKGAPPTVLNHYPPVDVLRSKPTPEDIQRMDKVFLNDQEGKQDIVAFTYIYLTTYSTWPLDAAVVDVKLRIEKAEDEAKVRKHLQRSFMRRMRPF